MLSFAIQAIPATTAPIIIVIVAASSNCELNNSWPLKNNKPRRINAMNNKPEITMADPGLAVTPTKPEK